MSGHGKEHYAVPDPLQVRLDAALGSQLEADRQLDELFRMSQLEADGVWSSTPSLQTVMRQWWLVSMYWQFAIALASVTPPAQDLCMWFCDAAERAAFEAMSMQSKVDLGQKIGIAASVSLPELPVNAQTYAGVWQLVTTLLLQVQTDYNRIIGQLHTERFDAVKLQLGQTLAIAVKEIEYCDRRWNEMTDSSLRLAIVQEAAKRIPVLFAVGQQLWSPYLVTPAYAEAVRKVIVPKPKPLELGFDPWILTDRQQRPMRQGQPEDLARLMAFWRGIEDPAAAYALYQTVQRAVKRDQMRARFGKAYGMVPWPALYLVRYPLTLGARNFAPGDLVAYFVLHGKTVEVRKTGEAHGVYELLGQPC